MVVVGEVGGTRYYFEYGPQSAIWQDPTRSVTVQSFQLSVDRRLINLH